MIEALEAAEKLISENRPDEAARAYEAMLAGGVEATGLLLRQLVPLYVTLRKPLRALEAAQALVYFRPSDPDAWIVLSGAQEKLGLNHEALRSVYRSLELRPSDKQTIETMLYLLASMYSPEEYRAEAERWAPESSSPPPLTPVVPSRPLRIGYVSGDFKHHVMDRILEPLLRYSKCEIICYDNTPRQDKKSEHLRQWGKQWKYIRGLKADAVAAQVVADGVQVLVDLSGLTAGNRLDVFRLRPAPVQVTMAGYLPTTGYDCFDWRIADTETQLHYTEPLWKLETAVAPMPLCPELSITPLPARKNNFVTFGYVNGLRKLTTEFIAQMISVLQSVPKSRLMLMCLGASDKDTVTSVLRRFGAVQDRVFFTESCGGLGFCRLFADIDIALDPFPYGGCITSFDTLYHGVPIITGLERRRIGQDAARLQSLVHEDRFIAKDGDYAKIAAYAAFDLNALERTRLTLRQRLESQLVGNPATWVSALENAFQEMFRLKHNMKEAA